MRLSRMSLVASHHPGPRPSSADVGARRTWSHHGLISIRTGQQFSNQMEILQVSSGYVLADMFFYSRVSIIYERGKFAPT